MKSKVRKEYEAALAKAEVTPFEGKEDVIDLYTDVVCGAVLVAEENAKQIGGPTWQNAGLCRTMLKYGRELEKVTGYGNVTDTLYWAAERMEESLFGHPRLRSELINFIIHLLHIIECDTGHDLSSTDHFMEKLARVDRNIQYADSGKLDLIEQEGQHGLRRSSTMPSARLSRISRTHRAPWVSAMPTGVVSPTRSLTAASTGAHPP